MADKKLLDALRNIKGRRIYQFYLDEKTGEITDITYSMEYVKPIRCKDCKHYNGDHTTCYNDVWSVENGYCWMAEREEDGD